MHLTKLLAIALTLTFTAGRAAAADEQPSAPPQPAAGDQPSQAGQAQTPAPGSLDEVLCEIRKEPYTGTHISYRRKVCKTRREWEEEKRIADRVLDKVVKGGDRKNPQGN